MDSLIKRDRLVKEFKVEVDDLGDEIDPNYEYHWESLIIGWSLGKGLSPDDANEFASYIRHNTDLG